MENFSVLFYCWSIELIVKDNPHEHLKALV